MRAMGRARAAAAAVAALVATLGVAGCATADRGFSGGPVGGPPQAGQMARMEAKIDRMNDRLLVLNTRMREARIEIKQIKAFIDQFNAISATPGTTTTTTRQPQ